MSQLVKKAIVTEIVPASGKGPAIIHFQVEGKDTKGSAKGWLTSTGSTTPNFEVHSDYREYQLEKKEGRNGEETWISPVRAKGGNRGGGMKADPEKIKIEAGKLELENQKRNDFIEKWGKDRFAEMQKQAAIISQVVLKGAIELELACEEPFDLNRVKQVATDLVEVYNDVEKEVFESVSLRANGGQ